MQQHRGVGAFLTRRPLVIHEQNAVAGTTNGGYRRLRSASVHYGPFAEARMAEVVEIRCGCLRRADRQELQTLPAFQGAPHENFGSRRQFGLAPLSELLPPPRRVWCQKDRRHHFGLAPVW